MTNDDAAGSSGAGDGSGADSSSVPTRAISPRGPLDSDIRPPGSKSITNRALVCAALADGRSTLVGALDSEDTQVMIESLRKLGLDVGFRASTSALDVAGTNGRFPNTAAQLYCGNSGTTIRFLTALLAGVPGRFQLDGVARMRERPIGDLVDALRQLGATIDYLGQSGFPPILVQSTRWQGGSTTVRGDLSSQFLSAMLMAAPLADGEVELRIDGPLVSQPYVSMTIAVMASFGVAVESTDLNRFRVRSGQSYRPTHYEVEPDASAASYFWGAAAIAGGRVNVAGLTRRSLQGDVAFCDCLAQMGCRVDYGDDGIQVCGGSLQGIDVDMNAISDTVPTLAAVALFAIGPTTIRGVAHIRHKETDRIGDLARELRKLGAAVDERPDGLRIEPQALRGCQVDTYRDHRMAMSLALVGLRVPGVVIRDPGCTAKTYPRFFDDLDSL